MSYAAGRKYKDELTTKMKVSGQVRGNLRDKREGTPLVR
ncbi:hypothetical protein DET0113 [Dehalococcoides mccartyi 195]|uniref:Uncharacterized protein n=1 Tax=Dehalococcoides mccartyi (strain ATCC BAA-2266 / KCTC 15142 / 195) TaxID=243164 RepID=Q3ZA85_DEHM1|nr:hypothetical protein DET0113 [Dehalococcoides mccartyi 195]